MKILYIYIRIKGPKAEKLRTEVIENCGEKQGKRKSERQNKKIFFFLQTKDVMFALVDNFML